MFFTLSSASMPIYTADIAPKPAPRGAKRTTEAPKAPAKRAKTSGHGTTSQPVQFEKSQLPPRLSPHKALAITASQATEERLFESQLRDMVPEDPPIEPSKAATEAITEESDRAFEQFDARFCGQL
jgi:hypothetical protein